ncbi:MAG: heme-binding protein [Nitrospiraceae bacterium]
MTYMSQRQSHVRLSAQGLIMITACVPGFSPALVAAEELPREAVLPVSFAATAAKAAVDQCAKDGYRVSAAVVDRAGILRAFLRADGAGPHTVDSIEKKAYTAASMRGPTGNVAELIAKTPGLQGLQNMNGRILFLVGGLPIEIASEVVGGIGVGGAPGGHLDAACAQAGLDSIGATPKFPGTK